MATISRQTVNEDGTEATYSNADTSNGDKITNTDGKTILHFKNPGASSASVVVAAQQTSKYVPGYGTMSITDSTYSLDAGEEVFAGPFPLDAFNDSDGNLNVSYSGAGAADVDVAALKFDNL